VQAIEINDQRASVAERPIALPPVHKEGEHAMRHITAGFFGPETIAAMSEAYEAALEELHDAGQPKIVREVIGERILFAASTGERNSIHLRKYALVGLPGGED
jgi:hypothetical protein